MREKQHAGDDTQRCKELCRMCRMGHGISLRGSRGHRDAVRAREGYPEAPAAAPTGTRRLPIAIGMGCRVYCGPNHFANTSTPDVLAMWRDAGTAPVETNQHEGANRRYRLKKSASRDADLTKPRSRPRSHASPGRQGSSGCGGLAPTTACTPEGASTPHDRPAPGQGRHTRRHLRI